MKIKMLIPALLLTLSLSGCWDRIELENRSFVMSLGIDKYSNDGKRKTEEDSADRFTVSMAIPNPAAMSDSGDDKAETVKTSDGETILSAIQAANSGSSNALYFGQTKLVVLGQETLSSPELLKDAADTLERHSEFSRKLIIMAAPDEAKKILEAKIDEARFTGMFVSNFYKNDSKASGISFKLDLETLIRDLRADGSSVIPMTSVGDGNDTDDKTDDKDSGGEKETKSSEIKFGGAAVIKDFKLAGQLTDTEMRGYLYVKQNMRGARIAAEFENARTSLGIDKISSKISFPRDGICEINIKIQGGIEEYAFSASETLDEGKKTALARKYEEIISDEILAASRKFRDELNTDGFRLKDVLRKKYNSVYKRHENEWDTYFSALEIAPVVSVEITNTGVLK